MVCKDRELPLSFNQISAIIFIIVLVINYTVYQILKAISDFKNNYRPLTIMYCFTILLTGLFIINIFFIFPNTQFRDTTHALLGSLTLLIALIFTIYDFVIIVINKVKKY